MNSYLPKFIANRSFRLPRLWSNAELRRVCGVFKGRVVNVSAWADEDKEGGHYRDYFPQAERYYTTNFGGQRGTGETDFVLDLSAPLAEEMRGRFDTVFNHTTLEHIFEMRWAFHNLCEMSRDVVIVVVPFAQEIRYTEPSSDFWRFTPLGVRALFRENDLEVIYEAASPNRNAGIYLLSIASRYPERWRGVLPKHQPVKKLGNWIGRSYAYQALRLGRKLWNQVLRVPPLSGFFAPKKKSPKGNTLNTWFMEKNCERSNYHGPCGQ